MRHKPERAFGAFTSASAQSFRTVTGPTDFWRDLGRQIVVRVPQRVGKATVKTPGQSGLPDHYRAAALLADLRRGPRPLVLASVAQALQAVLLLGLGMATLVVGITDSGDDLLNASLVAALALAGGLGLLAVARGLLGVQGWARAPSLVWQLILIPVGFTTMDDLPGVASPLLVSTMVVLAGLFAPTSNAVLDEAPDGPTED